MVLYETSPVWGVIHHIERYHRYFILKYGYSAAFIIAREFDRYSFKMKEKSFVDQVAAVEQLIKSYEEGRWY